jgi:glycosyltransferase involved in cell wall biosynthesis
LDQEKIYVVPNCVDLPAREFEGGVATGGDGKPYLLMVGATWKHKNAMEVLEEHQSWTGDFRLEIVSGAGQYCKQLKDRAVSLGIAEKVNFSNDISERELESLYRGCSALIYPSLMEGFGIPPLEAMARKRQVIVSDIPVFRELFGDAPYFVELGNSASWKRAFVELSQCSPESQVRRINEGLTIASRFSRERMDQALTAAVENIWSVARK